MAVRVLIAEDSRTVAEMLSELLSAPGRSEVVGTSDTHAGTVEAIRRLHPDVVILDLQLKSGSGTDVIREVRADPSLASTRLFVTSNHASPQLRAACAELGADGYFDKVKELGELAARVQELVA